jgi:hypothetical protein
LVPATAFFRDPKNIFSHSELPGTFPTVLPYICPKSVLGSGL